MKELIKKEKSTNNIEKILKIFTAIILFLALIIYEFLFCNAKFTLGLFEGNIGNFNFSFVRLIMYVIYIILYFKNVDKFIGDAAKGLKNKFKIIAIVIVLVIFGASFIYATIIHVIYYKIVLMILALLAGIVVLIYLSNDYIKNTILICLTFGMLFCCTTQFNGSLDEKRHFMSAYNVSIGNLNYKNNNKTEESIEQIPRSCTVVDSIQFFEKKYENKIYENNDVGIDYKATDYNFILYLPSALGIKIATILQGSIADIYIMRKNI